MPEPDRRSGRFLVSALVALVVLATPIAATPLGAQQAGHGTLPATGATAPGSVVGSERPEDPVIARIEALRRVLADTTRQYKKAKDVTRAERQRDLLAALARAEAEVSAARELLTAR